MTKKNIVIMVKSISKQTEKKLRNAKRLQAVVYFYVMLPIRAIE